MSGGVGWSLKLVARDLQSVGSMLEIRKLESDMIILLIIPSKKFQGKENHFIILTLVRANDVELERYT